MSTGISRKKGKDPYFYYLCGEVNAKNSLGGYIGYRVFLSDIGDPVLGGGETVMIDDTTSDAAHDDWMEEYYNKNCVSKIGNPN